MRLPRCLTCGWVPGETAAGPILVLVQNTVAQPRPKLVCPRCRGEDLRCRCGKPWGHVGGCRDVPIRQPARRHPWRGPGKKPA
ncbi:MAG: hypothetical protein ACREKK_10965 [Candidatus Methylomirabilales bacterium]